MRTSYSCIWDVTWLESSSEDVQSLKEGGKTDLIEVLTNTHNELQGEFGLQKVLKDMPEPSTEQIHVLVVVPEVDQEQWGEERTRKKARTRTTTLDIPCKNPFFKNICNAPECERWILFGKDIPSTALTNL
jgi:hypothetical protein